MPIKLLSDHIINQIAAGEVIERPASVIKELIENAIDAKADKIDTIIESSGKNLIIVSDNGIGIDPSELELAVLRHTTSKLNEDDLLDINTFGFRGEALPSIAAISKLCITSKTRDNTKATRLYIVGGTNQEISHVAHNNGTKIEVRDLFFATPARLKFLRSDKTELNACVEAFKKLALAHPNVSFSLSHNDNVIFKLHKTDDLKDRIREILAQDFIENSACINLTRHEISITGYTSIPTFNKATSSEQYLFINGRAVKDKIISSALRAAYQDYLARDRYPVATIYISIDPQKIDVNVHPAKSEVRFHDPTQVRGLLISAIRDAIQQESHRTSSTISNNALKMFQTNKSYMINPQTPAYNRAYDKDYTYRAHEDSYTNNYARHNYDLNESGDLNVNYALNNNNNSNNNSLDDPDLTKNQIELLLDEHPLGLAKAQLYKTYIISQTKDSIIITDQHAAHERLRYEAIKSTIEQNGLIKQRLLAPVIVELCDAQRAELLINIKEEISKLGLTLEALGEKSIIVFEIPQLLGDIDVRTLITDLADSLLECNTANNLIELIETITETYACHYSIRAGRLMNATEMNELLRQMEQTPFSGQCNHGRPTYIELKLKDIEKLFSRK